MGLVVCQDCGMEYADDVGSDVRKHNRKHMKYLEACDHFGGRLLPYVEREKVKGEASPIIHADIWSNGLCPSLQEKYDAAVRWFWAYFSGSVEGSCYDLKHPCFEEFVAMLLNQKHWTDSIDADVCRLLIEKFGRVPGIEEGHSYYKM